MTTLGTTARRTPPGPSRSHDLGDVREDPLRFVSELQRRYGDITSHLVAGERVVTVHRPDLARYVLKDNGGNYTKQGTPDDHMLTPLLGNGLLTSTGEQWTAQRRMCAPAFRSTEVRRFDTVITDATEAMLTRWCEGAGSGRVLPVDHQLTSLTLAIVVRAIRGLDVTGIGDGFGQAVDRVNAFIGHFAGADADGAVERRDYDRAKAFLDGVTHMLVAGRRGGDPGGASDLLAAMMAADHAGQVMSDRDLHDQVLTLIMAGHETTAKSLTWALYLLDRYPGAAEAVHAEVDRVLGGRVPTAADYSSLVECTAVIKEAMRLYPPIWLISRRAVADDEIDGYPVPAGTLVCLSQWVLHRDPRSWAEPERFDPQRFVTGAAAEAVRAGAYLPFGGGDRVCIGQHFALMEATLALAMITSRLRLQLVPGSVVQPEALVTLRPRHGMPMTAVLR